MRLGALITLVVSLGVLAFGSAAPAGDHARCPNGTFEWPVPQTEAELRQLPRLADGLDADPAPYTVDQLIALGNQIDANQDGLFCLKAVSNLRGQSVKGWEYFYGARDNDTSAS